jgi:hypothetical protein
MSYERSTSSWRKNMPLIITIVVIIIAVAIAMDYRTETVNRHIREMKKRLRDLEDKE